MPPVAAAVSPVRKSRVEKHGRELAVGGSVVRQRQEQNKATPPVAGPEGLPHFIHRLSE